MRRRATRTSISPTRAGWARAVFRDNSQAADLRFAVWAPNATAVDVVFGKPDNGYISDDGTGIDRDAKVFSLTKGDDAIFQSAVIPDFAAFEGAPYMYRLTNAQGQTVFRTDLFSREQIGRGGVDPTGGAFTGDPSTLDGTKGCSLVRSIDTVAKDVAHPEGERIPVSEFWATEFTPGLTVPSRIEDLIIYELHVNSLAAGENRPGNLQALSRYCRTWSTSASTRSSCSRCRSSPVGSVGGTATPTISPSRRLPAAGRSTGTSCGSATAAASP
jgi:1,4-alpha-glucan branching enzyme